MLRPKHWFNAKFAHLVDEHGQVMTEKFAERFVDHRHNGLLRPTICTRLKSEKTLHKN
jgi:hypothetical protein